MIKEEFAFIIQGCKTPQYFSKHHVSEYLAPDYRQDQVRGMLAKLENGQVPRLQLDQGTLYYDPKHEREFV